MIKLEKEEKNLENPYEIKPNEELVGLDEEKRKLLSYIKGKNICFLTGPAGVGKTSLLKWLKLNLKEHNVFLLDSKGLEDFFDLKSHLKENLPFWKRLFVKYPKNSVVLVDEAQMANRKLLDNLEALWNQNIIKSAIIVQINPSLETYSKSLRYRIGNRIIRLNGLNNVRSHELINLRTNKKHPFTDEAINFIAERSGFIPRKILETCEIISVELDGKRSISLNDAKNVLNKIETEIIEQEPLDLDENTLMDENALVSLEKVDNLDNISPMQGRIIKLLFEGGKTTQQLAAILNTSVGSVGKQLSELTKTNVAEVINNRRPKIYSLSESFKESLKDK